MTNRVPDTAGAVVAIATDRGACGQARERFERVLATREPVSPAPSAPLGDGSAPTREAPRQPGEELLAAADPVVIGLPVGGPALPAADSVLSSTGRDAPGAVSAAVVDRPRAASAFAAEHRSAVAQSSDVDGGPAAGGGWSADGLAAGEAGPGHPAADDSRSDAMPSPIAGSAISGAPASVLTADGAPGEFVMIRAFADVLEPAADALMAPADALMAPAGALEPPARPPAVATVATHPAPVAQESAESGDPVAGLDSALPPAQGARADSSGSVVLPPPVPGQPRAGMDTATLASWLLRQAPLAAGADQAVRMSFPAGSGPIEQIVLTREAGVLNLVVSSSAGSRESVAQSFVELGKRLRERGIVLGDIRLADE
ncbi:MAG: hypothetical protein NTV19_04695 [Burkholderiales bacterium]|nr:hypothetical protein [Burkholderiales bacterium]